MTFVLWLFDLCSFGRELSKDTEQLLLSVVPHAFRRGFSGYLHGLRLNRFGVDAYGTAAEMDRLEQEERKARFPWAFPD